MGFGFLLFIINEPGFDDFSRRPDLDGNLKRLPWVNGCAALKTALLF